MNRSQSWNQYLLVQKKVIKNEIENFWRSTELTLAVFRVPSNNPDKYLRDVFKEKRQQRKRETKKQNHMFYLLQEKRKKTIFCMRLPCDQKRMNSSNTGTYPRSHWHISTPSVMQVSKLHHIFLCRSYSFFFNIKE